MAEGRASQGHGEGQHDSGAAAVGKPIAVRIIDAPPTSDDQKQNYKDSYRLQRRNFVVGVITLSVLIVYTTINYCLYRATVDTEQVSQRAYVNVREAFNKDPLTVGKPLPRVWLSYENTGNTPATHFCITGGIVIGSSDEIRHSPPRPKSGFFYSCDSHGSAIVPPKVIRYFSAELSAIDLNLLSVTPGQFDAIKGRGYSWEVNALIDYCDQFGNRHQSEQGFFYDPWLDTWEADAHSTVSYDTDNDPECRQH
jgi:hypothetical protein